MKLSLYEDQRRKSQPIAKDILSKKDRKTYFLFSGTSTDEFDDGEYSYYYDYTEEQMTRIKELFVEAYNDGLDEEDRISSFEEIKNEIGLHELEGYNTELDSVINRCFDNNLFLDDIDFTPRHLYNMSYYLWNRFTEEISQRVKFQVELTDEEYEYLLTCQLGDYQFFTFNRLLFERPEIAEKISDAADSEIGFGISNNGYPFMVLLDEVVADVEAFRGPESQNIQIFEEHNDNHRYHVGANTVGRVLTIFQEEWKDTEYISPHLRLEEIPADEVMARLGANNYYYMLEQLKDRFGTATAFDDIKSWLDKEKITYVLKKYEY